MWLIYCPMIPQAQVRQQGEHETVHRDLILAFDIAWNLVHWILKIHFQVIKVRSIFGKEMKI